MTIPSTDVKVEGALVEVAEVGFATERFTPKPDGFFDGRIFDPTRLDDYIDGFEIRAQTAARVLLQ